MADTGADSWRTQGYRAKVISQIDDAVRQAGNPTNKTSMEMENHIYQKAKSRKEYMELVAKLILYVRDYSQKKVNDKMGGGGGPPGVLPGMPGGQMMGGPPPGMMAGQNLQDPIGALQSLTKQNMQPAPGQQPGQQPQPGQMGGMGGMPQHQQRPPFQAYQGMPPQRQPMPGNMQGMRPDQAGFMMQGGVGQPQMPPGVSNMMAAQNPGNAGPSQGGGGAMSVGSMQAVPSPLSSQSSIGMVHSPANVMPIPSPQNPSSVAAPSPVSRAMQGVPSPGPQLNTPGNPNSQGTTASPAAPRTADEQAYLEKLRQLQKYIEPLKRMIARIEKDEDRKKDLSKMKNLLDILSDSSKRLPMGTLLKCEQVLESFVPKPASSSGPGTGVTSSAKGDQYLCQPLMDAISQHLSSPLLNHTLQRTFGPAVLALHGPPIRTPSPPPKRQKVDEDKGSEVPNVLQGEIARLNHKFKVNLDPMFHGGSKTVHLICKLDDKNLPSVPPIWVTVPENYPKTSPSCETSQDDYDSTPFLKSVQRKLSSRLLQLPSQFSVTALLDTWEMSVRQACAPVK